MTEIRVTHFSDVLCVWAYVSQERIDELRDKLGEKVRVDQRFCPIFGDARAKLEERWKDRAGLSGYGAHVRDVAERFGYEVHPDVWRKVAPRSSLSCHIFLCAVRCVQRRLEGEDHFVRACWRLRQAFFRDLRDVSRRAVQLEVADELGIPVEAVEESLDSGEAHAELSADYGLAREQAVTVSPTLILNEGRQRLNGNVSFRVIEANVSELIRQRSAAQSSEG